MSLEEFLNANGFEKTGNRFHAWKGDCEFSIFDNGKHYSVRIDLHGYNSNFMGFPTYHNKQSRISLEQVIDLFENHWSLQPGVGWR